MLKRLMITFFLAGLASNAFAVASVGQAAGNVNHVLLGIATILQSIVYIAAIGLFTSAAMKYRIHRQNPQQIPLSTPITELVLAIVLAGLPWASKLANEHLFKEQPNLIQQQRTPHGPSGAPPRRVPAQQQQPARQ